MPDLAEDGEDDEGGDGTSPQTEGTRKALSACFDAMMPLGKPKKSDDDDDDSEDDENDGKKKKKKKGRRAAKPKGTAQAGSGASVAFILISDGFCSCIQADDPEKKKKDELKKAIRGSGPLLHSNICGIFPCIKDVIFVVNSPVISNAHSHLIGVAQAQNSC